MSALTLKKQLHKAIDETPDSAFLQTIYSLFQQFKNRADVEITLSEENKRVLDEEKRLHLAGKTKSFTIAEVRKNESAKFKK